MWKFVVLIFVSWILTVYAAEPRLVGKAQGYHDLSDFFHSLTCNIEGEGLTYEWFHNDTKIDSNAGFFLAGRKLYVAKLPVTEDVQGVYQCKASNQEGALLGPEMTVAFTIVGSFRQSDDKTQTFDVTIGKDLKLDCPPRSHSRNVYYHWGGRANVGGVWFIPQRSHYMIMEDGSLLFANIKEEDIDYFNVEKNGVSCIMESKGSTRRMQFSQRILLRQIKVNKVPFGPTIKTQLEDREVANGTDLIILRCGAVGLPTPTYSWTVTGFDGVEKTISSGQDGYELSDFNHILTIKTIRVKHDGVYKCKVQNSYGGTSHVDEVTGRISVKGKPHWLANGQLRDVNPTEGDSFTWTCSARANPNPWYTWLLNGAKLVTNATRSISGGTMTFQKLSKSDEGVYQCLVQNDFGQISSSAVLKLRPAPEVCQISKINLLFLIDGSGSVPKATFNEYKQFMQLLVKRFAVSPDGVHVGALQYSSKSRTGVEFGLGHYTEMSELQNAISNIKYHYGAYTYGGYAMKMGNKLMSAYSRYGDAKNVMVFLMDDGLWDITLARRQSKKLRAKGTQIIMLDTKRILYKLADVGLPFTTNKLSENVKKVADEICQ